MLFEVFMSLLLGVIAGTFTGLIPGIHINLIGAILVSISIKYFYNINPIFISVFIVSMAITHTFLDFIPSVFLGCPDTDTELSLLPGHRMLKEGKGYEAILLTIYGSIAAIIILTIISYPTIKIMPTIYKIINPFMVSILIGFSLFLIILEKRKIEAIFVFLITGILGIIVFKLGDTKILSEPLLPLLSGLFGLSMLTTSLKDKIKIKEQLITKPKTKLFRPLIGAVIASPLCSFLPGLGSGQAAVIGNLISRVDEKGFLVLIGATNTLVMGVSFISLYALSKTRTGAAIAIREIMPNLNFHTMVLILITITISGIISYYWAIFLTEFFSKKMQKINYKKLTILTITILFFIVFIISGIIGLVVLIISSLTGIICGEMGVKRTNMMGCILLPVIIFYI